MIHKNKISSKVVSFFLLCAKYDKLKNSSLTITIVRYFVKRAPES